MNGQYLVSSPVTSPVKSFNKPTPTTALTDTTTRTTELEKGMAQQSFSRESAPSITLGGM